MLQILPVDGFKWIINTSKFNKDFAKNYKGDSDTRHFSEVHPQFPEEWHKPHNDLPFFYQK